MLGGAKFGTLNREVASVRTQLQTAPFKPLAAGVAAAMRWHARHGLALLKVGDTDGGWRGGVQAGN